MNAIHKFINTSKQFQNVASTIFNNNYKLDHYAVRSFFVLPLITDLQNKDFKLGNSYYLAEKM